MKHKQTHSQSHYFGGGGWEMGEGGGGRPKKWTFWTPKVDFLNLTPLSLLQEHHFWPMCLCFLSFFFILTDFAYHRQAQFTEIEQTGCLFLSGLLLIKMFSEKMWISKYLPYISHKYTFLCFLYFWQILRAIDRPNLQRLSKREACPSQVYELIKMFPKKLDVNFYYLLYLTSLFSLSLFFWQILRAIDRPNLQRLSKPEACPSQVYELILKCWRHEPDSRPTFAEICEELPKVSRVNGYTLNQGSFAPIVYYSRTPLTQTLLTQNPENTKWYSCPLLWTW